MRVRLPPLSARLCGACVCGVCGCCLACCPRQSTGSAHLYGAGAFAVNELLTGAVFIAFLIAAALYLFESHHTHSHTLHTARRTAATASSLPLPLPALTRSAVVPPLLSRCVAGAASGRRQSSALVRSWRTRPAAAAAVPAAVAALDRAVTAVHRCRRTNTNEPMVGHVDSRGSLMADTHPPATAAAHVSSTTRQQHMTHVDPLPTLRQPAMCAQSTNSSNTSRLRSDQQSEHTS